MLKRFISMLLAAVMLLSLVGCGSTSESTKAKNGFYKVCGVYYPEELGDSGPFFNSCQRLYSSTGKRFSSLTYKVLPPAFFQSS